MIHHSLHPETEIQITKEEGRRIASDIAGKFDDIAARYDFGTYPPNEYQNFKSDFEARRAKNDSIKNAMLWKWGRFGREKYPTSYTNLIEEISQLWPEFVASPAQLVSRHTFDWWSKRFNRPTTFISAAYITHLVHHKEPLPIIDQHNFRAMNYLIRSVRPAHSGNKKPTRWEHIEQLKIFMDATIEFLPQKSFGDLDRFLMMYGRNNIPR